ncbi:MAG: hypothetical protein WBO36_03350, partial [Saprospiraceae bacterium]
MAKSKSRVPKRDLPSIAVKDNDVAIHTIGRFHQPNFFKNYWKEMSILFVASFAMYYLCLPYKYILDDLLVVTGNSFTKQGFSGIWDILTTESFEGYFGAKRDLVQGNRYRPLSIITFAIEYGIMGGTNAWLSHFINILLYAFTGISIMMVLEMMFRNFKKLHWWMSIPFLAALIFVVHPIHTEAVANIKGRDEIMAMLFSMLTLYFSLRYMDVPTKKWLSATLVSFLLALLSKENAITFLAVIPLTVYFFSNTDWSRLRTLVFWLLVATGAYLMLRFSTAGVPRFSQEIKDLMNNPFLGMNPIEKLGTIMYTLGKYILLLIWPHPLTHDYYPYAIPKSSLFSMIPMISSIFYVGLVY